MANKLAGETSPYLLQHAHNPVDWYPWGPEALALAREEDRPILLSVGYSACHWCHVMERESFEDPETAAQMNRDFVNVKVDREERPDLDEIYMSAVQAFSGGHGGWPMTVFLTPDGRPFFGGTYFPPEPRHGMPSFSQVMGHALALYRDRRDELDRVAGEVVSHIQSMGRLPQGGDSLQGGWIARVAEGLEEDFDPRHGGFGRAPKFPPCPALQVLLAKVALSGGERPLAMATHTLDQMARGGMYDLLGGGFARYSVDEAWVIPHFEKMLYDNAQLVPLYTAAWQLTGAERYARVVNETLAYVLREMTGEAGGFYASQDADSVPANAPEGTRAEEGAFFVWRPAQLAEVLGAEAGARIAMLFEVDEAGNFEHGQSVLRGPVNIEDSFSAEDRALWAEARPKLLAARGQRPRPDTDTKVITAWNGLMASAFAKAGAAFGVPAWIDAAGRALEFLLDTLVVDGRLQRTWRQDDAGEARAHIPGYLDDHAFLVQALLDQYEATLDPKWLQRASTWAETTIALFWDEDDGGLFYTGHDAERLVARSKKLLGGSEPSANGVAALCFQRLATLLESDDLAARAGRILAAYQPLLERAPRALGAEALAADWHSGGGVEIGVAGELSDPAAAQMLGELRRRHLPLAAVAQVGPGGEGGAEIPWLRVMAAQAGDVGARTFVCRQRSCQLPSGDAAGLAQQLDALTVAEDPVALGQTRDRAPVLPGRDEAWLNVDEAPRLEALRGQIVVMDFWTSCCINCLHLLPELEALEAEMADEPVTVIGVHSAKFDEEKERLAVRRAVRRLGVRHPVLLDPEHGIWQRYAVKSWPTVVVLDAEGRIAWRRSGEVDRSELRAVVQRLLDEGREKGVLAEAPALPLAAPERPRAGLWWPGKVWVHPGPLEQMQGERVPGPEARLYISDTGRHRIIECGLGLDAEGWPTAQVLRFFGGGDEGDAPGFVDGDPDEARLRSPQGVWRDGDTLFIADTGNHALRAVDLSSGDLVTLAGTGALGRGDRHDPDRPLEAALRSPWDLAGNEEAVFIAMAGTHQIWVYLREAGRIGPFIGNGREDHVDGENQDAALAQPSGLAMMGHYLFWADAETSSVRLADLAQGRVGTVVGLGLFDFGDVDGEGEAVRLQHPQGIAIFEEDAFVADTYNHKIKRISLQTSRTQTLGGGPAELAEPGGLAVAGDHLLIADTGNHRIAAMRRSSGELRELPIVWPED